MGHTYHHHSLDRLWAFDQSCFIHIPSTLFFFSPSTLIGFLWDQSWLFYNFICMFSTCIDTREGLLSPFFPNITTLLFSSVQLLSCVWLFVTPWIAARQASLSITNSRNPPKLMSIEWVMPSNHLILCRPLLLLPSIFASIMIFSNESVLCIRWPKYWSFSLSPSNQYSGLISFRDGLVGSPCSPRDSQESSPTPQFKSINSLAFLLPLH